MLSYSLFRIFGKDNNIISISTDDILCEWSLNNLSAPMNRYILNPNGLNEQIKIIQMRFDLYI